MTISQEDLQNYKKFDDPFTKQRILTSALTEKLREHFPKRELRTKTEFLPADENFGEYYSSNIREIIGRWLGFIPQKKLIVNFFGGGLADKVTVYDRSLREIVEKEVANLRKTTGASLKIAYNFK